MVPPLQFAKLPAIGEISKRFTDAGYGSGHLPPWRLTGEKALNAKLRERAEINLRRTGRSTSPATNKKDQMYWQRMRRKAPPPPEELVDSAVAEDMQFGSDLDPAEILDTCRSDRSLDHDPELNELRDAVLTPSGIPITLLFTGTCWRI